MVLAFDTAAEAVFSVNVPVVHFLHAIVLQQLLKSREMSGIRNRRIMHHCDDRCIIIPGLCRCFQRTFQPQQFPLIDLLIGGGEVGTEMAIYLGQKGHNVSVIEMKKRLSDDAAPVHFRSMVQEAYEKAGVIPLTECICTKITDRSVFYKDKENVEHEIPCDTVLLSAGMVPRNSAFIKLNTGDYRVYRIGDCEAIGSIQTAMRDGFAVGNNI